MSRKVWALCLLILLAVSCARAQTNASSPRGEKSSAVLPFDLIDNRIVINVRLDLPAVRLRFKNDPPKKRVRLVLSRDGRRREVVLVLRDLV